MLLTVYRRTGFATRVTVACALGAFLGLALGPKSSALQPVGEVFIRLLRMLVVPVVVTTLLAGFSAPSPGGIGRLGARAVGWCLGFSIVATVIGFISANWLRPGVGMPIPSSGAKTETLKLSTREFLLGIIPDNVIAAVVKGDLLAVVFFTILLGLAIASLRGAPSQSASVESLYRALETLREAVSVILRWVMEYAPIATFALVAVTFGEARGGAAAQFVRAVAAVYVAHALIGLLCLIALRVAGVRPIQFLRDVKEPLLMAFVTGSSAASLPLEIESAAKQLRMDGRASSFVLSLGAGIHKIGTAAHLAVMVVFAVNAVGAPVGAAEYALLGFLALAGAVGTPPISGGAYVTLGFIYEQAGLPLSLIGVLLAIPLLAKFSTPINSLGRLTVAALTLPQK
jgi:Na+/H+-dicarboxylate symporter